MSACPRCLARSWLLGRLGGHLESARQRIADLLALPDDELIAAVGGRRRQAIAAELHGLDANELAASAAAAGVEVICRCDPAYPGRLLEASAPPAVLHVTGGLDRFLELTAGDPVAIVGARQASEYGLEVARQLGRGLGSAGVTVVSGMALGVDCAAHGGALAADGPTIAVLPGGAERPYPPGKRSLYRRIRTTGAIVSELPVGAAPWRWSFPARNRIIAALSEMTVVIEGRGSSGALITARHARELGRQVGAVPGRISSPLAAAPNALLAEGAHVVRGAQDVLDALFGAGARTTQDTSRDELSPQLAPILDAVGNGQDTVAALAGVGFAPDQVLAALSALELAGYVRRESGGRYLVVP
jgi:DNA processing protein